MEAHVLDWVFGPELELVLTDEKERQRELEEDRVDVLLAKLAHLGLVEGVGDEDEGAIERLRPHKLRLARQEHLEVRLAETGGVLGVELAEEVLQGVLVGLDARVSRSK